MRRPRNFSVDDFTEAVAQLPQTGVLRLVDRIIEINYVGESREPMITTEYQVSEPIGYMHMGVMPLVLMIEMANQSLLLLARLIGICGPRDLAESRAIDCFEAWRFAKVGEVLTCRTTVLRLNEHGHRPTLEALATITTPQGGMAQRVANGIISGRLIGSPELLARLLARDHRSRQSQNKC